MNKLALLFLWPAAAFALPGTTELTLVDEPEFNRLTITVDPRISSFLNLADTETTFLTGTIAADLDAAPATGDVSELTLREGRIRGTDMTFSRSALGQGYTLSITGFSGTVFTTLPPGRVDPASGEFDGSQHAFEIDQGTITGEALGEPVDEAFTEDAPASGSGAGTGRIELIPTGESGIFSLFEVVVTLPVNLADTVVANGIDVIVTASGTLKATGSLELPRSEYLAWTAAEGISGADRAADANGDGIPNAIAWALGFEASKRIEGAALQPADRGVFTISLQESSTVAPVRIQTSDDLSTWTDVSPERVSTGQNPIPPATSGLITIQPSGSDSEFLRLRVDDPSP